MDYAGAEQMHFVRCLKCLKILKCTRYDTSTLLEHIRREHPEIEIMDTSTSQPPMAPKSGGSAVSAAVMSEAAASIAAAAKAAGVTDLASLAATIQQSEKLSVHMEKTESDQRCFKGSGTGSGSSTSVYYRRHYEVRRPTSPVAAVYSPRKKRCLYRTSIEKWCPTSGSLYCPQCGERQPPMIKTKSERIGSNKFGSGCLLGCWPFCLLPCALCNNNKEYLYCSCCQTFLGQYDCKNNCVRPNKLYVDCAMAH